ncbi:transglycosylase SLT domain-containing protein [Solidesulfovibrio magneticus]|nr:transglycosylase SLT domain-containing protein [Solidesulfovibrio magneticus]
MSFFGVTQEQIRQLSEEAAHVHGLPPQIVYAVIRHESGGGNVWAWNPEPKYRYFWDCRLKKPFRAVTDAEIASERPPADFQAAARGVDPDCEWWGQQASWGLMQMMGAVARERGFDGAFLNELHDPKLNIDIGCRHLAGYAKRYLASLGWEGVLRAYNGGPYAATHNTNPQYPPKVAAFIEGGLPHA